MPKDDSMDVRIAILESMVDDLIHQVAAMRRDLATKSDVADLQRQIDGLHGEVERLRTETEVRFQRIEERIARLEERLTRLEQKFDSEFKQLASKAEVRKDLLVFSLGIITVQPPSMPR